MRFFLSALVGVRRSNSTDALLIGQILTVKIGLVTTWTAARLMTERMFEINKFRFP